MAETKESILWQGCTALNIFDDISYNACNSRHGAFAAFYSNLHHISDINNNNKKGGGMVQR